MGTRARFLPDLPQLSGPATAPAGPLCKSFQSEKHSLTQHTVHDTRCLWCRGFTRTFQSSGYDPRVAQLLDSVSFVCFCLIYVFMKAERINSLRFLRPLGKTGDILIRPLYLSESFLFWDDRNDFIWWEEIWEMSVTHGFSPQPLNSPCATGYVLFLLPARPLSIN